MEIDFLRKTEHIQHGCNGVGVLHSNELLNVQIWSAFSSILLFVHIY